jgi:hypothetical protein
MKKAKPKATVRVSKRAKRMDRRTAEAKQIKALYRSEGADACLSACRHFKQTKREMLLLLAAFEAKNTLDH